MKKITVVIILSLAGFMSFAQVKRKVAPSGNTTTSTMNDTARRGNGQGLRRELGLTKEQQLKMKDLREANRIQRDAFMNDTKLTEQEKHDKMKALRAEQEKNIDAILTEDQRVKMAEMRKEMKEMKMNDPNRQHRNTMGINDSSNVHKVPLSH